MKVGGWFLGLPWLGGLSFCRQHLVRSPGELANIESSEAPGQAAKEDSGVYFGGL